jgi:hypothetical protein
VVLLALAVPDLVAEAAGIATALAARGAAIRFGLSVPVYKARPGRPPPDAAA